MTQTLARIKQKGKHFEILVDMESALKFKKGELGFIEAEGDRIFSDSKKGHAASSSDLKNAFGTTDINEIVGKIIKNGEVLVTQKHRDEEQEKRFRQVVDFLATNAVDPQTRRPHTSERIKNALEQSSVNIKNTTIENQIKDILLEIGKIIPIKLDTKKVKITIPAVHIGKAYGIINQYKGHEKWLDDGSLEVIAEIPSGMIMDFYDKLNSITHGSALTEEIKNG